jgi:hypothetical protein
MGGSVYFAVIVAVIFIVLAFVASPILLIPGAIVVLVAIFATPLLAAISGSRAEGAETGTPTTREASYEPVANPDDRSV